MPRGRIRETPEAAWRESERRILQHLPEHGRGTGFNELQRRTKVSPTTLSGHLARLVREGKAIRDLRTRRYLRTEAGRKWLDIRALLQEIADTADRIGLVGLPQEKGAPSKSLEWVEGGASPRSISSSLAAKRRRGLAAPAAAYALPSPGPSGLTAIANTLPETVGAILLADRRRRDLLPRAQRSGVPSIEATRDAIRGLPGLLILKIDWVSAADALDVEAARQLWKQISVAGEAPRSIVEPTREGSATRHVDSPGNDG